MKKNFVILPVRQDSENDGWQDVKVLSREEVRVIAQQHRAFSFSELVLVQLVCAVVVTGWAVWRQSGFNDPLVLAVAYGSACAWLPQLLQNWGMGRRKRALESGVLVNHAGLALVHVYTWEGAKIGLTLVMLGLAPTMLSPVRWLALVLGFVVCLKLGWWVALAWHVQRGKQAQSTSQVVN